VERGGCNFQIAFWCFQKWFGSQLDDRFSINPKVINSELKLKIVWKHEAECVPGYVWNCYCLLEILQVSSLSHQSTGTNSITNFPGTHPNAFYRVLQPPVEWGLLAWNLLTILYLCYHGNPGKNNDVAGSVPAIFMTFAFLLSASVHVNNLRFGEKYPEMFNS